MHIGEQRLAREMGVEPGQPRPAHFGGIARSPVWPGETVTKLEAFPIGHMKQACVADGPASLPMHDEPLAEAEVRLVFTIPGDSAPRVLQRGVRAAAE